MAPGMKFTRWILDILSSWISWKFGFFSWTPRDVNFGGDWQPKQTSYAKHISSQECKRAAKDAFQQDLALWEHELLVWV